MTQTIGNHRTAPLLEFAGFWRRIGAALIDGLILGFLGWAISHFFYDQLCVYGPQARLIGLPFALAYFGLGNSRLTGGATPGKRFLGLGVVSGDGEAITAPRSVWRALVYLIPLYVNGYDYSFLNLGGPWDKVAAAVQSLMVFGILLGSIYLYLANWGTRQIVHDLAAGTFVVRKTAMHRQIDARIDNAHLAVVGLLFLLSLAAVPAASFFGPNLETKLGKAMGTDFTVLTSIQTDLNSEPDILSTGVQDNTFTAAQASGPAVTTTSIIVSVIHRGRIDTSELFADHVAERVLRLYPDILHRQKLTVVVTYGYDVGIWSNWNRDSYSHTPDEWRARLHSRKTAM